MCVASSIFFCTIDKMSNDVIIFSYEGGSDRKMCVRISEKATAAAASKRAHVSHEPARGCQIRMLFFFFLFLLASLAVTSLLN